MSTVDFRLDYGDTKTAGKHYIVFQAGKGRAANSKLYIEKTAYSFLEGLIWNKYREYRNIKVNKISSNEWQRIVDGLTVAKDKLASSNVEEITKILRFNIMNPVNPITDISDNIDELITLLNEVIDWLNEFRSKEKYISIISM